MASGVDFTEYRVNGGAWVRVRQRPRPTTRSRPRSRSPPRASTSSSTARSTRPATRRRSSRSTSPSRGEDLDAPTAQGFADPSSGAGAAAGAVLGDRARPAGRRADLRVAASATAAGSFDQSPQHTYTAPGTYTATVTVTDPQGKTGTDTVEIVVMQHGNQAPVCGRRAVRIAALAPLTVQFSAQATDPDGPRASSRTCGTSMTAARPLRPLRGAHLPEPGTYTGDRDGDRPRGRVRHGRGRSRSR